MRVCHVTAHLPPDQAANALLPWHLGTWARERGDDVSYIAYPPRALAAGGDAADQSGALPGPARWVPARTTASGVARALRIPSLRHALDIRRLADPVMRAADVVHLHSNGLLPETAALVAAWRRKPVVLTLYGTEIWHYRPRSGLDLFTRMYRRADRVTFYSQGLLDRAREHRLDRPGASVIYPPVAPYFVRADDQARALARRELGLTRRHVLLNVKRLHPLAGQATLIEALPRILAGHPDTQLVFCGTGPLAGDLQRQVVALGLDAHVTFAGLVDNQRVALYYAAADLFVLPSQLEACPTVAVEALASGTPVVSSDNPGGVELGRLFGDDVQVVPRGDAARLADAVSAGLAGARRTTAATDTVLAREFHPAVTAARFARLYDEVVGRHGTAPGDGTA